MIVSDILQNSDSLKAAADTIKTTADQVGALQKITFEPSAILTQDGLFISLVGYLIVFIALVMLFLIFSNITKLLHLNIRKKLAAKGEVYEGKDSDLEMSGETNAAIATALYLYFSELHDLESAVLTIKKVQKVYSPWSSKIYGLRQFPKR